jgi:uncharacterized coiled-coil protein SlyX
MMTIERSESAAALEARLEYLTSRLAALESRAAVLDAGIAELGPLIEEIEERLRAQETAVFQARKASGELISFGSNHNQQIVQWTDGRGTQQLSGPRPLETPEGQADHARRVLDALELEAAPIRSTLMPPSRARAA